MVLDERTAAFMALGAARAGRSPVALVATSGTAVCEWLPAVTEADLSRVPLVLLSADRPLELRQRGANQTIDQANLFGSSVRFSLELPLPDESLLQSACSHAAQAAASALWPLRGPVHLNIPFREPLTPQRFTEPQGIRATRVYRPSREASPDQMEAIGQKILQRPGLIICGPETGKPLPADEITALAAALQAPLLADPLSNLRTGPGKRSCIISHHDACLRQDAFRHQARPEWVLQFGAMPVSKALTLFLDDLEACTRILVDPDGRCPDPLHQTTDLVQADPASVASSLTAQAMTGPTDYLELWKERERSVHTILEDALPQEGVIIDALGSRLPAGCRLFTGNSLPVRQLDWFFTGRASPLEIICNRGASGIDGNVATLLGIATADDRPLVGLLGDLTLVHDIGSLTESADLDAVILVLDNGGGGIFDHLPQSALEEHECLFTTPRRLDLETASKAFGLGYRKIQPESITEALEQALALRGVQLVHIEIDRERSLDEHTALWKRLEE